MYTFVDFAFYITKQTFHKLKLRSVPFSKPQFLDVIERDCGVSKALLCPFDDALFTKTYKVAGEQDSGIHIPPAGQFRKSICFAGTGESICNYLPTVASNCSEEVYAKSPSSQGSSQQVRGGLTFPACVSTVSAGSIENVLQMKPHFPCWHSGTKRVPSVSVDLTRTFQPKPEVNEFA